MAALGEVELIAFLWSCDRGGYELVTTKEKKGSPFSNYSPYVAGAVLLKGKTGEMVEYAPEPAGDPIHRKFVAWGAEGDAGLLRFAGEYGLPMSPNNIESMNDVKRAHECVGGGGSCHRQSQHGSGRAGDQVHDGRQGGVDGTRQGIDGGKVVARLREATPDNDD